MKKRHFSFYCMFVCVFFSNVANYIIFTLCLCKNRYFSLLYVCVFIFSISVLLLTLVSRYVYVSKHCVRKCMFVCYRVSIASMHVHFSICVYLQVTKFIWRIHCLYRNQCVCVFVFNMYLFIKHEFCVFICISN